MIRNIIFIGGIHGVGKTTLCGKVLAKVNASYYSASELIDKLNPNSISKSSKSVTDIEGNQNNLITAIDNYVDTTQLCLLDGHFCLLDSDRNIKRIPKKTFDAISPKAIITLHDNIDNIQRKNAERDAMLYDKGLLLSFQNEELKYSKDVASSLQIPYIKLDINNGANEVFNFIDDLEK